MNQLYSALDIQTDEQAIDKMINNLEQVKQNMPTLSSYVDNHVERLNSYKTQATKQPMTNENTEVEQIVNDDVNFAQNVNNDVTEGIEDIGTQEDNNVAEIETPSVEQEKIEQPIEEVITETQQIDNATNVTEEATTKDSNVDKIIIPKISIDNKKVEPFKFNKHGDKIVNGDEFASYEVTTDKDKYIIQLETYVAGSYGKQTQLRIAKPDSWRETADINITLSNFDDALEYANKYIDYAEGRLSEKEISDIYKSFEGNEDLIDYTEANAQAIETPTTNETIPNEQIVNEERNVVEKADTEEKTYRYYLTQRPPSPGAIPSGSINTVSFDDKQDVDGLEAWGYVEYDKPLTENQISDYELTKNVTETKQVDFAPDIDVDTKAENKAEQLIEETVIEETKEEQIEETKEELKERVEKLQETGTSNLSPNETKMYTFLVNNKDTDIDTLMDKFEIPRSNADGFDSQQRYVFVKELIEGAVKEDTFNAVVVKKTKDSKGNTVEARSLDTVTDKVITIKIPRDGTFRIKPDYGSISIIINRLGIKLKSQIPTSFKSIFAKGLILGDDFYTNGYIAMIADKTLLDEIKAEYKDARNLIGEKK